MPDWIHAIAMIVIWIVITAFSLFIIGGFLGLILGVSVGYLIAGQIVQRLPGFWGERGEPDREDKNKNP